MIKNLFTSNNYEIKITTSKVVDINYEKHQELLKQSTHFKKDGNLDKAIEIIYKAIENYPLEDNSSSYFKIAYYYQLKKEWDNSWKTYQNLIDKLNPNVPIHYTRMISEIYTEQVKHLKREKNLSEYVYYYSLANYTTLVYRAMNGVEDYVTNFYNNIDTFYDVQLIQNDELKSEYIRLNREFIESKKELVFNLLNYTNHKSYQMMDSEKLQNLLFHLNSVEYSNYYNNNLSNKLSILK